MLIHFLFFLFFFFRINWVVEKSNPPHVVNPLSVSVQANGKKRLILDLRHVNKYLFKRKVKHEDWKVSVSWDLAGSLGML